MEEDESLSKDEEPEAEEPHESAEVAPNVTEDNFEDYLVTDDLLVDYFNKFLSLFSFPKPVCFNKETETFEVIDNAKKNLLKQLKSLEHAFTPIDPIYNVTIKSKRKYPQFERRITAMDLKFETNFTVQVCMVSPQPKEGEKGNAAHVWPVPGQRMRNSSKVHQESEFPTSEHNKACKVAVSVRLQYWTWNTRNRWYISPIDP
ncbi:regulator of G-protein signaling 22-like [Cetorhinus maximus]